MEVVNGRFFNFSFAWFGGYVLGFDLVDFRGGVRWIFCGLG